MSPPSPRAPFHTQAAVLDRYVHSAHPDTMPTAVDVVVRMLRSRDDLRRYFFRSGPTAGWARILWDSGFFGTPPAPHDADGARAYPYWDVQEYLVAIARDVPDLVLRHVQTIDGPPMYIARALRALRALPSERAEEALPRMMTWLQDPVVANGIAIECWGLMQGLAQDDRLSGAFAILRALTTPTSTTGTGHRDGIAAPIEAIASSRRLLSDAPTLADGMHLLRERALPHVVTILEDALRTAEGLSAQSSDPATSSWWRQAIEDTGHDLHDTYRDTALRELRVSLEEWIARDPTAAGDVIERYLRADLAILRRLGIHLLRRAPMGYGAVVARVLTNTEHLDDVDARHELLLLLRDGYPHLSPVIQDQVVAAILDGPPGEATAMLADWARRTYGEDPDAYGRRHEKVWVRDRLWMIHDHLAGEATRVLEGLIAEMGQPEQPEQTRRAMAGWVQDVSPLTEQELAALSPDEVAEYVRRWQPPPQAFSLQPVTHTGLARSIARLLSARLDTYARHLQAIARERPEYAYAILEELIRRAEAGALAWDIGLAFCDGLMSDDTIRLDTNRGANADWRSVRLSIVRLLRTGVEGPEHVLPAHDLPRTRDLLLALVDDPDPDPRDDRPPEGWMGHRDPATVALNHVRPSALSALVVYAARAAQVHDGSSRDAPQPGPQRLEPTVRATLTRKVDREEDGSQAVHSVYGRHLALLYWLDQQWTEEHLERILPEGEDDQAREMYVAAWDSYVIFNDPYAPLLPLLRPKYERAIRNLARGDVTRTHLQPTQSLASHILAIYLHSGGTMPGGSEQESLIELFFGQAPAEARGSLAWLAWRVCEENASDLARQWTRIRALWAWRTQEAIASEHAVDFDAEMEWFAHLLPVAAERETIVELWPLLEGMIPHVARSSHQHLGREPIERYVRREVERDPARAMQWYRLVYERETESPWPYSSPVRREILERAAADERARRDALSLIDALARRGDYQYQDIYERYAG